MARIKVLISVDEDILALIDRWASEHRMTRSGFMVAAVMGLVEPTSAGEDAGVDPRLLAGDTPHEYAPPTRPGDKLCTVCGNLRTYRIHDMAA